MVPGVPTKRENNYKNLENDKQSRSCVISMTKDRDKEGIYQPETIVTGRRKENPTTEDMNGQEWISEWNASLVHISFASNLSAT